MWAGFFSLPKHAQNQLFKSQSANYQMQIWQEILILLIALFPRDAVAEEARNSPDPLGLCPVPLEPLLPASRWAEPGHGLLSLGFHPGGCIGIVQWLVVDKYAAGMTRRYSVCVLSVRVCLAITSYSHNSNSWTLDTLQALCLTVCDSLLLWFFCQGPCISLFFSIVL